MHEEQSQTTICSESNKVPFTPLQTISTVSGGRGARLEGCGLFTGSCGGAEERGGAAAAGRCSCGAGAGAAGSLPPLLLLRSTAFARASNNPVLCCCWV